MNILERYHNKKADCGEEEIVFGILKELSGRKGFDDWFENIDQEIQIEILDAMVLKIMNNPHWIATPRALSASAPPLPALVLGKNEEVEFANIDVDSKPITHVSSDQPVRVRWHYHKGETKIEVNVSINETHMKTYRVKHLECDVVSRSAWNGRLFMMEAVCDYLVYDENTDSVTLKNNEETVYCIEVDGESYDDSFVEHQKFSTSPDEHEIISFLKDQGYEREWKHCKIKFYPL